jgi:hypothetical protein
MAAQVPEVMDYNDTTEKLLVFLSLPCLTGLKRFLFSFSHSEFIYSQNLPKNSPPNSACFISGLQTANYLRQGKEFCGSDDK